LDDDESVLIAPDKGAVTSRDIFCGVVVMTTSTTLTGKSNG
jgi:hypothetical protein